MQGLGGALLAPAALSLLMTTFAEGRERNRALGIYGAASGSGAAAGVLLGGVITSYLGWSWIFFVNVPVALAAIALTPFLLRDSRAELAHRHFDLAGAATVTGGLMVLVYGLTRAATDGWSSPVTLGLLAGAAALVAAFVWIESRSRSPLLPLRIFRLRALSAANVTMLIVGAATFSEFFLLTLYVQDVLHYSAVQSGVAFVAFALSVVVASNLAQAVVGRIGVRGDAHDGPRARHGLGRPAHAGAGATATTSGISSRRSSSAERGSASPSCRSRSRASPAWSAPTRVSPPVS